MTSAQPQGRQHYWDSLRAALMLLGIPYHVALSYRPGQQWIVRSDEGVAGFAQLAEFIHLFRMPAFFVIAGYFAAMLLTRREPYAWLKGRFTRLGIPFLASIVTLVPIMNLACEFSNLPYDAALRSFVHNSSKSGGYWVRHLWFIVVLLYCCTALAALAARSERARSGTLPEGADGWMARHFTLAIVLVAIVLGLWEAAAVEAFYIAGLATNVPQQILRLDELIIYAPYFIAGCLLQRSPQMLARFGRFSVPVALLAVVFIILSMTIRDMLHPAPGRLVSTIAAVASTQVVIAAARSLFDRPVPLVQRMTDASYVIYLFHLPLVCVLVWLAQPVAIPTLAKALAVMGLTLLLSYAAWLAVSRHPVLAFLFNGETRTARKDSTQRARVV